MKAYKWDFVNHRYHDYEIPDHWHTPLLTDNMDEIINCARCGTRIKYGPCYVSITIHNHVGLGYPVCPACHIEEWKLIIDCK